MHLIVCVISGRILDSYNLIDTQSYFGNNVCMIEMISRVFHADGIRIRIPFKHQTCTYIFNFLHVYLPLPLPLPTQIRTNLPVRTNSIVR